MLRANDGFVSNLTNLINPVANSVQVTARFIEDNPEVYKQEKMNNYLLVLLSDTSQSKLIRNIRIVRLGAIDRVTAH